MRSLVLGLLFVACAPARSPRTTATEWRYEVEARAGALLVDATFTPSDVARPLVADAAGFARALEIDVGDGFESAATRTLPPCRTCRVRYRFALAEAAERFDDEDVARAVDGAFLGAPSAWLLHPRTFVPGTRVRYRVHGARFASGHPRDGDAFVTDAATFAQSPTAILGAFDERHLVFGGSTIDVAIPKAERNFDDAAIDAWVRRAGDAIGSYYGSFPVKHALLVLLPHDGKRVGFGRTRGGSGATTLIDVGRAATAQTFEKDWVLPHELVHLGFPWLEAKHHWLEEGIATYVEPIARARRGLIDSKRVFRDLVENVPYGLPREGDRGLDRTSSWGRTYWGGALYCLLADVEIRKRTNNARSLEDALRAIHDAGGDVTQSWSIERVLSVGDAATGTTVMRELYDRMATKPMDVDLDRLWRQLGVSWDGARITFDDGAELAAIRRAIAS